MKFLFISLYLFTQAKAVPLSNDDEDVSEKAEKKAQLGLGEDAIVGASATGAQAEEALARVLS